MVSLGHFEALDDFGQGEIQRGVRLSTVGMSFGGKTMQNWQNHEEFKRAAAENMDIK